MTPGSGPRMINYGVTALVLGLYAVVAAWFIGGEGEAYRKNLRAERATNANPHRPSEPGDGRASRKPKPPAPIVETAPNAPSPASPPQAKSSPTLAEERTTPKTGDRPGPIAKAPAPTPAKAPPIDPFWGLPDQKQIWDLDHLTTEDERRLGLALNQMIRKFHPPLKVGPLPSRLEAAAEPYLNTCTRKGVKYTFTVLDCESPNVFSHPGGYIYVCRGLFDWIAEDEDYALEFAIAHEMAHVDLAHAIKCLRDPDVKKLNLGTVPLFYFVVIPWGYKAEQDLEADKWACERMIKLGRSPYETLAFLRKLEDYSKRNGFENEPLKPTEEPRVPWLDNHLRTHPIPRNRLKELKPLMSSSPKT